MPGNDYRLFAAIPIPKDLQKKLADWGTANRKAYSFQKWAHPDDLHITLFFLGDTAQQHIPTVEGALTSASSKHGPIRLQLGNLGSFGPPAAPSIFWAGVDGEVDRLRSLQKDVSKALASIGYEVENKSYKPHITLARRYNGSSPWNGPRKSETALFSLAGEEWTCRSILLYRSHLGQSPMYESIAEFKLPLEELSAVNM